MRVKFIPSYDECCNCVDDQIRCGTTRNCKVCKDEHEGLLLGFVCKKKETFAVVSYKDRIREYAIDALRIIEE